MNTKCTIQAARLEFYAARSAFRDYPLHGNDDGFKAAGAAYIAAESIYNNLNGYITNKMVKGRNPKFVPC